MQGADAVHAGLATHFASRADLPALSHALAEDGPGALGLAYRAAAAVLAGGATCARSITASAPTVWPRSCAGSRRSKTPGQHKTLAALRTVSPSALCWTLEALRRGANLTLPQCQAAELALTRTTMRHPDFAEGVRAMVVDKDRKPRWQPSRIEEVDPAVIAAMFD